LNYGRYRIGGQSLIAVQVIELHFALRIRTGKQAKLEKAQKNTR
jgi:hypothetical protein